MAFVPFKGGKPSGPWEVFADGFAQRIRLSLLQTQRPVRWEFPWDLMVLCTSPKASGVKCGGLCSRVTKTGFGEKQLAGMAQQNAAY